MAFSFSRSHLTRAKIWQNPCGCFKLSVERGTLLFAMFDIATGVFLFVGATYILVRGDYDKENPVYPSKDFNMPRELVIAGMFLGYFNAATGLGLYFATGYRVRYCLILWLILNLPLALINFVKIYELLVVYCFARELKFGKAMSGADDDLDTEPNFDTVFGRPETTGTGSVQIINIKTKAFEEGKDKRK